MDFSWNADVQELRAMLRTLDQRNGGGEATLKAMQSEQGYDQALWQSLCEMGLNSVLIDERFDGAGMGIVAMGGLCETLGECLLPSPFFAHAMLACDLLNRSAAETLKLQHLPAWASGSEQATLAINAPGEAWNLASIKAQSRATSSGFCVSGSWGHVPHGAQADQVIVATKDGEGELFLLLIDARKLRVDALETLDQTRRQARLSVDQLELPASALIACGQAAEALLQSTLDRAAAALAFEQVGLAQACINQSLDYAKIRRQFGRTIGSFQAIKHMLADMLTQLEAARSASLFAVFCADHDHEHLPFAASCAQTLATQASLHCAGQNIQIHGGIGFTWEHSAHLYFKRARANANLLGDERQHLLRAADLLAAEQER
jgi:alkylation response protein AidB-like acyl-CoA dehydrogenase